MIFTRLRRLQCTVPIKLLVCFMIVSLLGPGFSTMAFAGTNAAAFDGITEVAGAATIRDGGDYSGDGSAGEKPPANDPPEPASGDISNVTYHTVTYHLNGYGVSGGTPAGGIYKAGATVTVKQGNDLGLAGKDGVSLVFAGWNTKPDAGGTDYYPGDSITVDEDIDLFAVWKEDTIAELFELTAENGAYIAQSVSSDVITANEEDGQELNPATGANAGGSDDGGIIVPFNVTIYTVTFVDWDGSELKQQLVPFDSGATAPNNPTRTGYEFTGWDTDFSSVFSDLTVKALYRTTNEGEQTKDLNYTIEYYLDGKPYETIIKSVTVPKYEPDALTVQPIDVSDNRYTNYLFDRIDPVDIPDSIKDGGVIKVYYVRGIIINYVARTGGSVNPAKEALKQEATAKGSTATAASGYTFVNWTDESGKEVSANAAFIPVKINNENVAATYYANFKSVRGGSNSTTSNNTKNNGGGKETTITDEDTPKADLDLNNHFAYLIGYQDNKVHPVRNITRAEATTIFFRLLTQDSRAGNWSTTSTYPDVTAPSWFNNAVSTLTNGGIAEGYPDGAFKPDDSITRAEFATIAVRFMHNGEIDAFPDSAVGFSDTYDHWAGNYIKLASSLGYVNGYEDGAFRPDMPITRGEVATLLNNVLKRQVESEDDLLDGMKIWNDAQPGAWYYLAIQEATNSHYYKLKDDGISEIWTELRQNPDWSALEKEHSTPDSVIY